jgi:hypothetical protein
VFLSRDDILKAEDIRAEEVHVPEWGGTVLVRGMSGRQRDDFEASMLVRGPDGKPVDDAGMDSRDMRARIVSRCVVDEDGALLFTPADIEALSGKGAAALDRVFAVASRLSGLGARDVEELAEDFGGTRGGGSPSNSPPTSARPSKRSSVKSPPQS